MGGRKKERKKEELARVGVGDRARRAAASYTGAAAAAATSILLLLAVNPLKIGKRMKSKH